MEKLQVLIAMEFAQKHVDIIVTKVISNFQHFFGYYFIHTRAHSHASLSFDKICIQMSFSYPIKEESMLMTSLLASDVTGWVGWCLGCSKYHF